MRAFEVIGIVFGPSPSTLVPAPDHIVSLGSPRSRRGLTLPRAQHNFGRPAVGASPGMSQQWHLIGPGDRR